MNNKKIDERTFDFALKIIELYKFLNTKNEYILSKQLLRSATSVGANVEEARESKYWLRLLDKSNYLNGFNQKEYLMNEVNIITKIVKTTTQNNPKVA